MKFIVAASLLAASAFAAPSTRRQDCGTQPSKIAVQVALSEWLSDVLEVNRFSDTSPASANYQTFAQDTLNSANDEPNQLAILASICNVSPQYSQAVITLKSVFFNVPTSLQSIVNNPSAANAEAQLKKIDDVRCCNVLTSLDIMWPEAASIFGLDAVSETVVPRPAACASVNC